MEESLYCFATSSAEALPDKWWKKLHSENTVIKQDALYKCLCRADVTGDLSFSIYEAKISDKLSKNKIYHVVDIAPDISFYYDDEFGFLEFKQIDINNGEHAVEIFNKLLTKEPPYVFFL